MSDIETAIKAAAEKAVLKIISDGNWLQTDYASRFKLPADFIVSVWGLVDADKVRAQMAARIEAELADRIVNHMAAEISTDIKQILSVNERREAIRSLARQNIEQIMKAGS